MTNRRYPYPSMVISTALGLALVLLLVVIPSSRSQATTVEDLTAGLTQGVPTIDMPMGEGIGVWNEVQADGTVTAGVVAHRDGVPTGGWVGSVRMIWNPIGAASWGRYYTNGLYVAGNGQYVLPGETTVRTFGSDATPPPTVTTTTAAPTVTAPGGITGVEAYIINSNGVRCHLTNEGYWDHSRSCVDSSRIQFALCFQGSGQLGVSGASLGMTVSLDGSVVDSTSYPPPGIDLFSYPSCQRGHVTSWAFDLAERGRTYQIDVWGRAGGVDLSSSWVLVTPNAPAPAPSPTPEAPTTSATTTTSAPTTTTTTTVPTGSATTPSATITTTASTSTTTAVADATTSALADISTTAPAPPPAGAATIDGQATALTLTGTDTAVTAQAGDVVVEVTPTATPDTTDSTATTASGVIEVAPDQEVEVATSGFRPDSEVEIWLHSEPMLLARAAADGRGALRTAVRIPPHVPAGDHRLVVTGRSPEGKTVSVAMAVRVHGDATTAHVSAFSESSPSTMIVVTVVVTLALCGGVLTARRRLTVRSS